MTVRFVRGTSRVPIVGEQTIVTPALRRLNVCGDQGSGREIQRVGKDR